MYEHDSKVVSQQVVFIWILVLFTGYALTLKYMLGSFISLETYVNSLCSVQLSLQGAGQDHAIKSVEHGLNTLFFILCPNSNAACRNYRENTELSVLLLFCFFAEITHWPVSSICFLRKTGCWHSWCVSASNKTIYWQPFCVSVAWTTRKLLSSFMQ